jgi:hypothetical protein
MTTSKLRIPTHAMATLLATVLVCSSVQARYARPQLEDTPVDRLVANLTKLAEAKPDDVTVHFNLARAHAMSFALRTDTVQVRKGKEAYGAWLGYAPRHIPFAVKPEKDAEKLKAAKQQLQLALKQYEKVLILDPNHLSARLGHAWCLQQDEETMRAIQEYRKTIELGWEKEKKMDRASIGWHSVTAEAAGYLTPLLDKDADKAEIAELQARTKQVSRIRRPITPIAIPLRDGMTVAEVEDRDARVTFDVDGTGVAKTWSWVSRDAAWLVYDQQNTGSITSGLQLFGSVTFWMFWDNGYQALASLDDNRDGKLADGELSGLSVWHDANSNGISESGEIRPLAECGIIALSCLYQIDSTHPDSIAFSSTGVTLADGTTRPTFDIVLHEVAK